MRKAVLFLKSFYFRLRYFLLLITLLAIVFSCTEKPEAVGLDLVDDNKYPIYDTILSVVAYSVFDDSVRTDEATINLLGSLYSETFGLLNASFYTQLRLESVNPSFGPNPVADSIVLSFIYSGYYGNLNTPQTVKIYRVSDDFYRDSLYYYNTNLGFEESILGELTFLPKPNDSIIIDSVAYAPKLNVHIDPSFADLIFTADSNLASNDNFINYFKGLYVKADDVTALGEGAILYFDLLNEASNLTLYYKNDTVDSLSYVFTINVNNARIGRFEHDYSLSSDQAFKEQILNNDTSYGADALYLQCLAGIKTVFRFPEIANWNNIAINQAKLILPVNNPSGSYDPPPSLVLFQNTENGSRVFLQDYEIGESYFGGTYDSVNNSYFFRISFYIQELANGNPDYGLELFPISKVVAANEVKLSGTESTDQPSVQLQLIYTEIKPNY
ncbi:MAG: DUF4270 domain-containing protein [Bacteroidales bacterium]|nr:DUF4270 domain-containing protein [Bacteroidales bacterium]